MDSSDLNILIGGEAGQGLASVANLLAKTLVRSGYSIVVTQIYESRIRGGHNTFAVRVAASEVVAPRESVDLLVALDRNTLDLHRNELSPGGVIIADEKFDVEDESGLSVPFGKISELKFSNVAALGIIGSLLGLDEERVAETVEALFGKKSPDLAEANRKTLRKSFAWAATQPSRLEKLPAAPGGAGRLMLDGNEAIALGALSAGLRFYAFYPMTPSTSIALTLIHAASTMGLVVEQAEDEIAAVNMAIGASFAGAPSMVGTSGGGFALMVEGVSLAAMTETPLVIVVAQRPGPATGLPTRTEQADLDFVLHAGHGEFPRAVFTPGTVEECFHLTRRAMDLAWRFQTPIFVLTDQFLADSYRAVTPFEFDVLPAVGSQAPEPAADAVYERYAITETGVSPCRFPGMGTHPVVADSDEHTEAGHITEDLALRSRMVEKRLRKGAGIREDVLRPEYTGEEKPDLLLVSWGSCRGAVSEAASALRANGKRIGTLHFPQVWPLVPDRFLPWLEGAAEVVSVEGNAAGQFARLVRRETGFEIRRRVARYDGLPITPEFILRELDSLA